MNSNVEGLLLTNIDDRFGHGTRYDHFEKQNLANRE